MGPGFSKDSLDASLKNLPARFEICFLGGVDMLGIQEDTVAAHGVRRMYPWFRPGAAYVLTNTGAESALKTCTPLRWRLDCQLAGYAAASRKHLPAADRLFGPSIHPIGYFLTPP